MGREALQKTLANGKPRCQKYVMTYVGRWPQSHQCESHGSVERDGKRWCKTHDPVAEKERNKERDTRQNAQFMERRYEIAGKAAMRILRQIAEGHNDPRALAKKFVDDFDA